MVHEIGAGARRWRSALLSSATMDSVAIAPARPFFPRLAAALACALGMGAGMGHPAAPSGPCSLLLSRLPGVTQAQCSGARLVPSGGRSHQGRPLYWRDVGAPSAGALRVLVVGAIHGDEPTSASLALQWIALAEATQRPVHWRFIPVLNPDGLLARPPTRTNARGVDLNRNFETPDWEHEAPRHWEQRQRRNPRRWPGPAPLSEPESQFLQRQIETFAPQLVVSIHAPYGVLDFDGPHPPPQRLGRLRLHQVGVFPGSLGHYGGLQQGLPVVTIELTHAQKMPDAAQVRAMWRDLLRWMDAHLQPDPPPARMAGRQRAPALVP